MTSIRASSDDVESRTEQRPARHAGDALRVVVGLAVFAVTLLAVQRDSLTLFERDVFRLVNDLSPVVLPVVLVVMQAGSFVAAPAAAAVALLCRRVRLAVDLVTAGTLAYVAAKVVKRLVSRPRPGGLLDGVIRHGTDAGMGFVSGHAAVVAALATAASPYLPRRWRRVAWSVVGVVALARLHVGAHLPLDVVGGAALGWVAGAVVHLALGAPHRAPTVDDAGAALARSGYRVHDVRAIPGPRQGSYPFVASTPNGELFVKLLDPEPRDHDWLFRLGRFLAFRDVRDEAVLEDTTAQAEHETAMALLARQAGCRVPAVLALESRGGETWIVEEHVGAHSLGALEGRDVCDGTLVDLWRQVATLHDAQLVHRDLVAENVVVGDHGEPWLVDFAHARRGRTSHEPESDVAELLVTTALTVGACRAVDAAVAGLGAGRLARCLPELQPLALTATTRHRLRHDPMALTEVRAEVGRASGEVVAPVPPFRATRRGALIALAGVAVVVALVAAAGPWDTVARATSASWRWCGLAVLAGASVIVQGASLLTAVTQRRLALGRTALVRTLAIAAPVVLGAREATVFGRYLARAGVGDDERRAALGRRRRVQLASSAVLVALLTVAVLTRTPSADHAPAALVAALVSMAWLAAAEWHTRGAAIGWHDLPLSGWAVALTAGVLEGAGTATVLVAAEKAAGGRASLLTVALLGVALAVVAPLVAGGPGALDAGLVVALVAVGLALPTAVATTVIARAVTYWVPVVMARPLASRLTARLVL